MIFFSVARPLLVEKAKADPLPEPTYACSARSLIFQNFAFDYKKIERSTESIYKFYITFLLSPYICSGYKIGYR